jgi:hypothetical protein
LYAIIGTAQTPSTGATSAPSPGKSSVKTDMVPSLFVMNARGEAIVLVVGISTEGNGG